MNDEATHPYLHPIVLLGAVLTALCLFILVYPASALAQSDGDPQPDLCYAVANVPRDKLYSIDPQSGVPVVIGEIFTQTQLPEDPRDPQGGRDVNAPTDIEALEFLDESGELVLYAVSQRNFGTLDWTTGEFTPIGEVENGFGQVDGISFNNVDGIAYDQRTGRMLGVQRRRDGLTDLLFVIDVETGDLLPNGFGPDKHYVEMAVVRRDGVLTDLDDIVFGASLGEGVNPLYGVMNEAGAGAGREEGNLLVTIDPANGSILTKKEILRGSGERSCQYNDDKICDVEGLTVLPPDFWPPGEPGSLLATSGFNYRTTLNNVYRIDPATGMAREIVSLDDEDAAFPLLDTESIACPPPPTRIREPEIDIVKYTNGQDANDPDGAGVPIIAPGDPVTWTYKVTNIGLIDIPKADITVTDNIAGVNPVLIEQGDGDDILAPDESWFYQALGTALDLVNGTPEANWVENVCSQNGLLTSTATAYTNVGTVTLSSGATASDPSSYCTTPAIALVKLCNGADANTPEEAPDVPLGGTLNYEYVITNTGGMALEELTLTDDPEGPISCPKDTLAREESITCTLSRPANEVGLIANLGTVVAFGEGRDLVFDRDDLLVTAEDVSHCRVIGPAVALEAELDFTWLYRVLNPNPTAGAEAVDLLNVVLDAGADIVTALLSGDEEDPGVLNVGETWTYGVTTPALPAPSYLPQFENPATASAETGEGVTVTDTCVPQPLVYPDGLAISALLNGEDATSSPGLPIDAGAALTWQYTITNRLDQTISELDVQQIAVTSDSAFVAATCTETTLAAGESTTCSVEGTAQAGAIATAVSASGLVSMETLCETPERTTIAVSAGATTYYYQPTGAVEVRGRVFQDFASAGAPANGIQEPDEAGIAGIVVQLLHAADETPATTAVTTNEVGRYTIQVPQGAYVLRFEVPAGHPAAESAWTLADQGYNDHLDSDVTGVAQAGAARTQAVLELRLDSSAAGVDAGLITPYTSDASRIFMPVIAR